MALSIGGIDVSWSKNSMGMNHGHLFQEKDRRRFQSDQIDYDYFKDKDEDDELAAMEIGFIKPLRDVLPRLELLGYSLARVKQDYERAAEDSAEDNRLTTEIGIPKTDKSVDFETFLSFIREFAIKDLDTTAIFDLDEVGQTKIRGRFNRREVVEKFPFFDPNEDQAYSELSYFGGLVGFLLPYSILRVLAENPDNLSVSVTWQYGPLVEAGWEKPDLFNPLVRRRETFLIATEGSSDAHILRHAIDLLRPEMSDFFRFIDMSDRHPFPGTGNLHKFAEGLCKIDVHNQLVLVYDNDAEGRYTFMRTQKLGLPDNMRVALLPDLEEFKLFPTIGPDGQGEMNINGRAAAIECYLDLTSPKTPDPVVRWSKFFSDLDAYQGVLESKGQFMKAFLNLRSETMGTSGYDFSKINCVLDALYWECVSIAENA
ncbi:MAG: hypothetical protein COC00_011040 [Rhizobiales bacterium]|nr:hypothetical protein [Hyphomicrobiales bacterium]